MEDSECVDQKKSIANSQRDFTLRHISSHVPTEIADFLDQIVIRRLSLTDVTKHHYRMIHDKLLSLRINPSTVGGRHRGVSFAKHVTEHSKRSVLPLLLVVSQFSVSIRVWDPDCYVNNSCARGADRFIKFSLSSQFLAPST